MLFDPSQTQIRLHCVSKIHNFVMLNWGYLQQPLELQGLTLEFLSVSLALIIDRFYSFLKLYFSYMFLQKGLKELQLI